MPNDEPKMVVVAVVAEKRRRKEHCQNVNTRQQQTHWAVAECWLRKRKREKKKEKKEKEEESPKLVPGSDIHWR